MTDGLAVAHEHRSQFPSLSCSEMTRLLLGRYHPVGPDAFAGAHALLETLPLRRHRLTLLSLKAGHAPVLEVVTTPYATGDPLAAVPATPIASQPPTVTDFRIRAWAEGAAARIIVFAVSPRPDGTETET